MFVCLVCLFVQITMILHCIPYFHCLVPLLLVNFPTFVADHLISVGDFPPEDGPVRRAGSRPRFAEIKATTWGRLNNG